jgi:membrane-bound metal-dependent hydrolase YbcI (DUF457 family)
VSFIAFCTANVLIDLESLYNLRNDRYPVHEFFHTYLGASIVIVATFVLFVAARKAGGRLPDLFEWKQLTRLQVLLGAAAGAYSHVVLDSIMHGDMAPLAPFSQSNTLLAVVSLETLHWFCAISGLLAALLIGYRMVNKPREYDR